MSLQKRVPQVPGEPVAAPAQPVVEPQEAEAPSSDPADASYWRNRKSTEAHAYWSALPDEQKGTPFSVLCVDGWYVAPYRVREVR